MTIILTAVSITPFGDRLSRKMPNKINSNPELLRIWIIDAIALHGGADGNRVIDTSGQVNCHQTSAPSDRQNLDGIR